jgi:carbamoyl-phosphate synthase large subunit
VIPTIDTELTAYAVAARQFADAGITVSISSPETVRICGDKVQTHAWLVQQGFPTVRQACVCEVLRRSGEWPLPLIAKPPKGSASIGIRRLETPADLECLKLLNGDYVIQEVAEGSEFTVNLYVNKMGECVCAIPHLRMEVRAGEVSKGVTVRNPKLIDLARQVATALPIAYGALNMQCFISLDGIVKIIEINARFGGGYPLAHCAGARFTDWVLDELEGKSLCWFEDWMEDLTMLRYDEAVFVHNDRRLL